MRVWVWVRVRVRRRAPRASLLRTSHAQRQTIAVGYSWGAGGEAAAVVGASWLAAEGAQLALRRNGCNGYNGRTIGLEAGPAVVDTWPVACAQHVGRDTVFAQARLHDSPIENGKRQPGEYDVCDAPDHVERGQDEDLDVPGIHPREGPARDLDDAQV